MLELEDKISLTKENIEAQNLTHLLSDDSLEKLGAWCYEGYQQDKQSRRDWELRTAAAMDLAMQITQSKNFPWADASNVAFPLVTIAVMQFHARAYPAILPGPDVVKCRVIGDDPSGNEKDRARRVSTHMSYQVLEESADWEEQHDRLIINVACVGTAFKKTYRGGSINHSDLVMAKDLVMNYYSKSVNECPRKTHIVPLFRNDIYSKVKKGVFRDVLDEPWFNSPAEAPRENKNVEEDKRHGITPGPSDESTPFITLEQHVDVDLDQDGYAEPYIITIDENTQTVVRIVTRFERPEDIERNQRGEIVSVNAREYFTKYPFIPSPDGGIYDIGFGVLLGPLNESANSLINQLIDAGTMATTAGGFLGRGAKIRGGEYSFAPLEWKRIDSTVDDLRKAIYPLPVREPSNVLFQLLSLIIQYTNKISGTTDVLTGENPGQNTPAETSRMMVSEGQRVYSGIYKRIWRSMKEEFKKLFILNGINLPAGTAITFGEGASKIYREDYLGNPDRVVPAADPNVTSEAMSFQKAQMIKQAAMTTPGYNLIEVEKDFLKSMKVDSIDRIYPGPDKVPPLPNPKVQIETMRMQLEEKKLELSKMEFAADLQEQMKLNQAKIIELNAKAAKELAEGQGVEMGHKLAAFNAALGALKAHNESMSKRVDQLLKVTELGIDFEENQNAPHRIAGGRGMEKLAAPPMHGATPNGAAGPT